METEHNENSTEGQLDQELKDKAREIASQLSDSEIPEGMTRDDVAIKRAQQWFLDMEG